MAIRPEHIEMYGPSPNYGKESDSRSAGFVERYGRLVQVEVEALAPVDLRALIDDALMEWWDRSAHAEALEAEEQDRARL